MKNTSTRAVQLIENSISASNDYENTIIDIKLLLRPLLHESPFSYMKAHEKSHMC